MPKFAIPLPVFGPAGSIPRVDAGAHPDLTITMTEIDQQVLPQGSYDNGPPGATCPTEFNLRKTRVWAYQSVDSRTSEVLGPAHWPAVTIVAQHGTPIRAEYVNELPSFDPSNPTGPGLVQKLLPMDQTLHWADPLKMGCGMPMPGSTGTASAKRARPRTEGSSRLQTVSRLTPRSAAAAGQIQPVSYQVAASMPDSMPDSMPSMSSMPSAAPSSTAADTGSDSPCRQQYTGPVPATVHLHGAELAAAYDGDPESWFTPNGLKGADYHTIGDPRPGRAIYEYPNSQEPGTLWFHDHALGITRLNVYAGLAGFYFLKDPDREPQGYPSGPYEIEMAVQDRMFDTNSQLYLLNQIPSVNHPFWTPIFEGDVATVNGAAFPYLNVEPRRYRFHVLNGSLNRGFSFVFGTAPVYVIGGDDNYFDNPVLVKATSDNPSGSVGVSPGERVDIIVDFSRFAGQTVQLTNTRKGQLVDLPDIMQFRVAATTSPDASCDPENPDASNGVCARKYPLVRLTDGKGNMAPGVKIDRVRQLILYDYVKPSGNKNGVPTDIIEYTNNTAWNGLESPSIARDFPSDGISELPRVGSVEMWEIVYLTTMKMGSHPVHLHLSQFQVLNRQSINTDDYLRDWNLAFGVEGSSPAALSEGCKPKQYCLHYGPPLDYLTPNQDGALGGNLGFKKYIPTDPDDRTVGAIIPPTSEEQGWKDTAEANARQILRILVRWTPSSIPMTPGQSLAGQNFYEFDPTVGYYVWHCHVLTHEDNEMMRPYRVTK